MTVLPWWLLACYGFLFGSVWGSFAAVVVERTARRESLGGRSHCACGRQLRIRENIPVLGWLRCRGVARCCGARLPVWYVGFEALLGTAGAVVCALWGYAAMAVLLVVVTVVCRVWGLTRRGR